MFENDLDVMFNDFGVAVTWGTSSFTGIFDAPDELIGGGMIISGEYSLIVRTADVSEIFDGNVITVEGNDYLVRSKRRLDDGAVSRLVLGKVSE